MNTFVLTERAESDLYDIWAFIADDSPEAADRMIAELEEACRMLATLPRAGRTRPDIDSAVRSYPVGEYLIFYSEQTSGIVVVRVLHGRRDISRLFRR